jgi:uncharacterized repeat protein (TIGR01451 family)
VKITSKIALILLSALLISSTFAVMAHAQPPLASISLTKTSSATLVLSGSSVSYLYNATNTGETALTGNITDDVFGPVGSFVNLQPGGWVAFNITHVITEDTTNTATVTAEDQYGSVVTDSAIVTVKVLISGPHLDVTKTGTPAAQPAPGTVTWNVTVTNIGTVTLTGVNVTDSLHGYLGSTGSLGSGETIFFTIVETNLPAGVYTDVATAYGYYEPDDVVVTDSGSAECVVGPTNVIPEIPLGTLVATASLLIGFGCYFGIPKIRQKRPSFKP